MEESLAPATPRYLGVLVAVTFAGFFFVAFDAIVPLVATAHPEKFAHDGDGGRIGGQLRLFGDVSHRARHRAGDGPPGAQALVPPVWLGTAVFSSLTAAVANVWAFAVVRFLANSALGTIQTAGVLITDQAPAKRRGAYVGVGQAAFPCGAIVASLVASWLLLKGRWRPLFLWAFLPAVAVVLVAGPWLREPPRFLQFQAGRRAGRTAVLRSERRRIFSPDLRRQTLACFAFALLVNYGVGFVVLLSVTYLTIYDHLPIGRAALALSLESLGTVIGQAGSGFLADYFSPRDVLGALASWVR